MSAPGSRAAELAAQQVEQIVAAAQGAADEIRAEAEGARKAARDKGKREAEQIRQKAKEESEAELMESRKQAVKMGQQAREEADGRVAGAERAAADVLKEAQALSGGLRQLGRSLEEQADRILRDVQAAHRRMQADLRVQSGDELPDIVLVRPRSTTLAGSRSPPPREAPSTAAFGRSMKANPFEDLDVPGLDEAVAGHASGAPAAWRWP